MHHVVFGVDQYFHTHLQLPIASRFSIIKPEGDFEVEKLTPSWESNFQTFEFRTPNLEKAPTTFWNYQATNAWPRKQPHHNDTGVLWAAMKNKLANKLKI